MISRSGSAYHDMLLTAVVEELEPVESVHIEEIRLVGKDDSLALSIVFRSPSRPGMQFGVMQRIYESDGSIVEEDPQVAASLFASSLQEQIDASDMGLPRGIPGTVVWLDD